MKFVYATRSHQGVGGAYKDFCLIDVNVTYSKRDGKEGVKMPRFSFSSSVIFKAFKDTKFLRFAYSDEAPNKIWITNGTKDFDYALSKKGKNSNRPACCPSNLGKVVPKIEDFVGYYDLFYDPVVKMWYIDKTKKIVL